MNKITKASIIMACLFSASSYGTLREIYFPYGQYKEVDFKDSYINAEFERFVTEIQTKDIAFSKDINKIQDDYNRKKGIEERKIKYRKEAEQNKNIYSFNYKEKKTYNEVRDLFFNNEMKSFNSFVQNIKSNPNIANEDKKELFESIKPLYKAYMDMSTTYKFNAKNIDTYCFQDPKKLNKYFDYGYSSRFCGNLYPELNSFAQSYKSHINVYMSRFTHNYTAKVNKSNFKMSLQNKIDNIKSYENNK